MLYKQQRSCRHLEISDKGGKLRAEEVGKGGNKERTCDVLSESTAWCDVL